MYEIKFDKRALHFLNKLEHNVKKRIWEKLQECKQEPFRYLKHLTQINGYKLRVGDYRIIIAMFPASINRPNLKFNSASAEVHQMGAYPPEIREKSLCPSDR